MSNPNSKNEKTEIIEAALLQSIGGGAYNVSGIPLPGDCMLDISSITCKQEDSTKPQ